MTIRTPRGNEGHPLLADGGEEEETAEDEAEEIDEETVDEDESEAEADEEEADEETDEPEDYEEAEGTNVLHLDLQGLFLDLLGLEVDLDEVVLNVRAVPGEGKLLGNLLGEVAGLLDKGPLGGIADKLGGLLPSLGGDEDSENGFLSAITGRLRDWLGGLVKRAIQAIPVKQIVTTLLNELLSQLFGEAEGAENAVSE